MAKPRVVSHKHRTRSWLDDARAKGPRLFLLLALLAVAIALVVVFIVIGTGKDTVPSGTGTPFPGTGTVAPAPGPGPAPGPAPSVATVTRYYDRSMAVPGTAIYAAVMFMATLLWVYTRKPERAGVYIYPVALLFGASLSAYLYVYMSWVDGVEYEREYPLGTSPKPPPTGSYVASDVLLALTMGFLAIGVAMALFALLRSPSRESEANEDRVEEGGGSRSSKLEVSRRGAKESKQAAVTPQPAAGMASQQGGAADGSSESVPPAESEVQPGGQLVTG